MGATVLIVEDQALIACHLQSLVEEAGQEVLAIAYDSAAALAEAARRRPDFALMDIRLADGSSGIDVARQLYEMHGVRCIFISANIDAAIRLQTERLEPLGFVGKPFLATEVIAALRRAAQETVGC